MTVLYGVGELVEKTLPDGIRVYFVAFFYKCWKLFPVPLGFDRSVPEVIYMELKLPQDSK